MHTIVCKKAKRQAFCIKMGIRRRLGYVRYIKERLNMLKLYKRTIIVSIWIFIILLTSSVTLKILFPNNDTISFLQNYIIGITCSILVVIITTFLQYKSEYEKVMSEFTSVLRQAILNLTVALSYQEKNVEEKFCRRIIEKIKDIFFAKNKKVFL